MKTVIIGGGWSGLAAAVRLAEQGQKVTVLEAAKQLGGRARNVEWQNITIDNGQHLMIGAYSSMLKLLDVIGVNESTVFSRKTIDITLYDDHYPPLTLSAQSTLPWPASLAWNLFKNNGFTVLLQVVRLQRSIKASLAKPDTTVINWLHRTRQSERLIKQLWEPLCLATLNTSIEQASAHVLATVIEDSLGRSKKDSDLLIPIVPLGDVFPQQAADYITARGGDVCLQSRVKKININQQGLHTVTTDSGESLSADNIIVATSPAHYSTLLSDYLPELSIPDSPITTVYLHYPSATRLRSPMLGMTGTVSQWVFDRSEQHPGLLAVVISAEGPHLTMSKTELIEHVCHEVHQCFPEIPTQPQQAFVIREKRATFLCSVSQHQKRPNRNIGIKGLWLAGDAVANSYPATLEGAIRNGEACAFDILAVNGK